MTKVFLIGNLCADPQLKSTQNGTPVCTFTVAVNRRKTPEAGQPEADFYRVTAWRQLAENCNRFLAKGKKVGVVGSLTLQSYVKDGVTKYSLEVQADEVEFLSARGDPVDAAEVKQTDEQKGFVKVDDTDDLPF
jgi:single-strand DNA-binding protein